MATGNTIHSTYTNTCLPRTLAKCHSSHYEMPQIRETNFVETPSTGTAKGELLIPSAPRHPWEKENLALITSVRRQITHPAPYS